MIKEFVRDLCVVTVICFIIYGIIFLSHWSKNLPSPIGKDSNTAQVKRDVNDPNILRLPES